jgi:hypothetical protein
MKTIIDQVTLRTYCNKAIVQFFVRKKIRELFGKELVFDSKKMTIKRPTLDSKKIINVTCRQLSFHVELEDIPNVIGVYDVIQIDEDTLILKKSKHVKKR